MDLQKQRGGLSLHGESDSLQPPSVLIIRLRMKGEAPGIMFLYADEAE